MSRRAQRIAVFRALQLGDMLVAAPALRALRTRFPEARLTLIGLPWASELVQRLPWLDDFIAFPGHPGLPEREPDASALNAFFAQVASQRLDLAVQLHGSGEITNGIVARFGAACVAGFYPAGDPCPNPGTFVPWPLTGREAERLLQLPLHLGAPHPGLELAFERHASDRAQVDRWWESLGGRPAGYVCVHPGARWRSRRWPAERFAEVAAALRARGCPIVLTGSTGEAETLARFRASMQEPLIDAAGRTSLGGLAELLAGARLLLCNDTGVSHLAAALRTPSVVVSSGADAQRWAPIDTQRHRMLHHATPCRPCTFEQCPYGHECALGVSPERVLQECLQVLGQELQHAA
jgi:ADP-heptose:LPS heptosyltransferase